MIIKKRKLVELEIIDLAYGGMGLAKPDGFPVFVDKVFPGDKCVVKITRKKKNYAKGVLVNLIEPSSLRNHSPCKYSNYCGGCKWQSILYKTQLEYKKKHVIECLDHIADLQDIIVKDIIPCENIHGFRNKMEFSCTNRRWLLSEELENSDIKKDFGLGLHVPGAFDKIIDIEKCYIQPELGNKILCDAKEYIKQSGLLAYCFKTHKGFWRFLVLKNSLAFNTWMVNIVTKNENNELLIPMAEMLIKKYKNIISVVNNVSAGKSGVAIGEYEILLSGNSFIKEKLGKYIFEISANSFFQTNTRQAEKLYSLVSHYAALTGIENVIDLYSGTGTISIWLSQKAKKVIGIELIESAVQDAKRNADINNIKNCCFYSGDIKHVLPGLKKKCDVMIIDPPRAGMHKDVLSQIMSFSPQKIVYVSCNPATLARDIKVLKSKYKILEIQPIDMFPHTFHIESVANLEIF
ncbi:MAG: 23S rRNA (uracil(1939)-C(5))-methyltransferase RlmD [Desulfobacteraceae bacterium 4572_130]|nr:MAG: 23S rRNA (uracil(1939)-C(5))-methyltransferase RlmD [Desulfobacteraceae bacterium 4572_130]